MAEAGLPVAGMISKSLLGAVHVTPPLASLCHGYACYLDCMRLSMPMGQASHHGSAISSSNSLVQHSLHLHSASACAACLCSHQFLYVLNNGGPVFLGLPASSRIHPTQDLHIGPLAAFPRLWHAYRRRGIMCMRPFGVTTTKSSAYMATTTPSGVRISSRDPFRMDMPLQPARNPQPQGTRTTTPESGPAGPCSEGFAVVRPTLSSQVTNSRQGPPRSQSVCRKSSKTS